MKTRLASLLFVMLLTACVSNPKQPASAGQDLLPLRREAASAYQSKDYAKALPLYETLVQRVPTDALLWFRLGNLRARLKQPDQAILAYRRAVELNPALDKAWHNMSILYLRQATNSLTQMLQHTDPRGPLYSRALKLSDGVIRLLEGDHAEPARH